MIRSALLVLALLTARPAAAICLSLSCDTEYSRAEATERLSAMLGALPEGVEVERLLQGGFQDVFVQARLSVDEAGLRAVLDWAQVSKGDLRSGTSPYLGPEGPAWFDWARQDGLRMAEGLTDVGRELAVAVAPDPEAPGRWRVFLYAFAT